MQRAPSSPSTLTAARQGSASLILGGYAWLFFVAVLISLLLAPAAGAKPKKKRRSKAASAPTLLEMADGMRLVHVPMPGSGTISMRFIVQSGGQSDPVDKAGLAHLLEHLVFHGTYDSQEGALFDSARSIGALINAYTSPEWTTYVLDGPADTFIPLASDYLKTITNPALPFAKVARENDVVMAEQEVRSARSILWGCDQLLFPSDNRGRTVIGTEKTRAAITPEDLSRFYSANYRTKNIIAVLVGEISLDDARALLQNSVLLPPTSAKPPPIDPAPPNLGAEAKSLSWTTATAIGYLVPEKIGESTCHGAARLLDRELMRAVRLDEPLAASSAAFCTRIRGRRFLVALAFGTSALSSQLPSVIDKVFASASEKMSSTAERDLVMRAQAEHELRQGDPAAMGNALMFALGRPGGNLKVDFNLVVNKASIKPKKIRKMMKQTVQKKRRFLLHLSPFEG